jgi:hypothetical protein
MKPSLSKTALVDVERFLASTEGAMPMPQTVATFLSQTALLKRCQLEDLLELAETADQQAVPQGRTILQPGRPVEALGLLLKGGATLYVVGAGGALSSDPADAGRPLWRSQPAAG